MTDDEADKVQLKMLCIDAATEAIRYIYPNNDGVENESDLLLELAQAFYLWLTN